MDKTPQIAEEQLVMTMDKASKIQKLAFRCFLLTSAKAKKCQDGDRSIRLYTTISLQLRLFFQKSLQLFIRRTRIQKEAKRSILQDYEVTDTDTHTQDIFIFLALNFCSVDR